MDEINSNNNNNQKEQHFKTPKIVASYSYNHIKNNNNNNNMQTTNNPNNQNQNQNQDSQGKPSQEGQWLNKNPQQNFNKNLLNNKDDELRQTLKRGAPKVSSNKLPSAFGNITNPNKKSKQNQFFLNNANNIGKQNNQENSRLKNIDHLVDIQEYKQAQNLLSPIKVNEKKKPKNNSKNPLIPMQQYLYNYQKANEEINQSDFQKERINKFIVNQNTNKSQEHHSYFQKNQANNSFLLSTKLKLEEMITLGLMKGNRHTGLIKQMLHAPTLQLYAIKEEPISNKDVRNSLKDWVSFWQTKFKDTDLHIKLYGSFWNTPEGCVSILMEHLDGGSLQNLLESVGCMPERALKEISQQILGSLQILHEELNTCHGAITPSQILFNRDGNVKLSIGISYRVNLQNNQFSAIGKPSDRNSLYDPSILHTPNLFNKQNQHNKNKLEDLDKSQDILKFGLMMLIAAIGDLEILDNHQFFFENLKELLELYNKNPKNFQNQSICCVIHSEDIIYQINNKQTIKNPKITLIHLLKQGRLSSDFLDFICCCTKIDIQERYKIQNLLNHPFIKERKLENKSPKIYLKDLIKTSSNWDKQDILPQEFRGASEKQLNRLVDALSLVLPNCEKWFNDSEYTDHVKHINNLSPNCHQIESIAQYLGLNSNLVFDKIQQVYSSIQFSQDYHHKRYKKQVYHQSYNN